MHPETLRAELRGLEGEPVSIEIAEMLTEWMQEKTGGSEYALEWMQALASRFGMVSNVLVQAYAKSTRNLVLGNAYYVSSTTPYHGSVAHAELAVFDHALTQAELDARVRTLPLAHGIAGNNGVLIADELLSSQAGCKRMCAGPHTLLGGRVVGWCTPSAVAAHAPPGLDLRAIRGLRDSFGNRQRGQLASAPKEGIRSPPPPEGTSLTTCSFHRVEQLRPVIARRVHRPADAIGLHCGRLACQEHFHRIIGLGAASHSSVWR